MVRKQDYSWRHYLPRAKSKRGWRGRKGGSPASFIQKRRPQAERPGKAVDPVVDVMTQVLSLIPDPWRKSITFDNGAEFARHYRLHDLGMETFFCDTRSPWQKGWSRTPSAGCAEDCPARRTWPRCCPNDSPSWRRPTTTPHAGAWDTEPLLK